MLATGNILCYARTTSRLIGLEGAVIAENGGAITVRFDLQGTYEESMEECEKAYSFLSRYFNLTKLDPLYRKTEIALRRDFDLEKARKEFGEEDSHIIFADPNPTVVEILKKSNNMEELWMQWDIGLRDLFQD